MRLKLKCKLKDCAYCKPTKKVYKYNRHNAELSEEFLLRWWKHIKDKPSTFLFDMNHKEVFNYE